MAKKKRAAQKGLVDPTRLKPFPEREKKKGAKNSGAGELLQVIIETPRGSSNKYSFDEKQRIFSLKAVLPAGMSFPYDFGFIPATMADDGDPLDVMVLMDQPAFPGCAMQTRLIGVIQGEQIQPGKPPVRNDRIVAVCETTQMYENFKKLKDMPKKSLRELEEFFVNYHKLQGKQFKLLGCRGAKTAMELIEKARSKA